MSAKHTPGPWKAVHIQEGHFEIHRDYSAEDGGKFVPIAVVDHHRDGHEETRTIKTPAYAHLIAAAPDLLEALNRCRALAIEFGAPIDCWSEQDREALHRIDAAIAKAEGR